MAFKMKGHPLKRKGSPVKHPGSSMNAILNRAHREQYGKGHDSSVHDTAARKIGSPNKFIGMGLGKRLRESRLGRAISNVAGSGMLGAGGMMANQLFGGGGGNQGAEATGVPAHSHNEEGETIPMAKRKKKK